jgi:hypothetical protein
VPVAKTETTTTSTIPKTGNNVFDSLKDADKLNMLEKIDNTRGYV